MLVLKQLNKMILYLVQLLQKSKVYTVFNHFETHILQLGQTRRRQHRKITHIRYTLNDEKNLTYHSIVDIEFSCHVLPK